MRWNRPQAFTLVELLVVIGIIAVLISVLLPALGAARRQSQAVKCLTQLREIGNAFQMYAIDNQGFYPPAQLRMADNQQYSLDGTDFLQADGYGVYWFNFLNKYVSRSKAGRAGGANSTDSNQIVKSSVIWGCPNWEGYQDDTGAVGSTNRLQVGYGMNGYPTFMPDFPKGSAGPFGPVAAAPLPPDKEWSWNNNGSNGDFRWSTTANRNIGFVKQKTYGRMGANRLLVADSRFWLADSGQVPSSGVIPAQMPEVNANNQLAAQTSIFMWRHGKVPSTVPGSPWPMYPVKGKIGFNILYCDNHVATSGDPSEAYRAIRMKFPG